MFCWCLAKCFKFQWKIAKIPMFSRGFCDVLLGYPLAILHPRFCSLRARLLGYPLAIGIKNASVFNEKSRSFHCFPLVFAGFGRLPPISCTWKMLQFSMQNRENSNVFSCFLRRFARLPPRNFASKTLHFSLQNRGNSHVFSWFLQRASENHAICNATSRKFQRFARLPPGNFAWKMFPFPMKDIETSNVFS